MNRIMHKVQEVMIGEKDPGPVLGAVLLFFSAIYGVIVNFRAFLYDLGMLPSRSLSCRVISIGNLTVGGTGKTPMTIYLAQMLKDSGHTPVVISRGYKGAAEKQGGIVSDAHNVLMGPDFAGDEPYMMATRLKGIPVLVGADRFQVGMKAMEKFSPDVIILDDAFQHRQLKRDLDVVLVDDKSLFGNRHLLPRGVLREPVSVISRSDLLVLTRCDANSGRGVDRLSRMAPNKPIFKSYYQPYICGIYKGMENHSNDGYSDHASGNPQFLKTSKVFVFSGIARNREFRKTAQELVGKVLGMVEFKDHHQYAETDFIEIISKARKCSAEFLMTTEKDYVKIAGKFQIPMAIVVVGIGVSFGQDEKTFSALIKEKVAH